MAQCGLIHNVDAGEWTSYLIDMLRETNDDGERDVTIKTMAHEDTDVLACPHEDTLAYFNDCKCISIVVLSPGLLKYLENNPSTTFDSLVTDPQRTILFYCGVDAQDIETEKLTDRFPYFHECVRAHSCDLQDFILKILDIVNFIRGSPATSESSTLKDSSNGSDKTSPNSLDGSQTGIDSEPLAQGAGANNESSMVESSSLEQEKKSSLVSELTKKLGKELPLGPKKQGPKLKPKPKPAKKPVQGKSDLKVETQKETENVELKPQQVDVVDMAVKTEDQGIKVKEPTSPGGKMKSNSKRNGKKKPKGRSLKLSVAPSRVPCERKTEVLITSDTPIEEDDSEITIQLTSKDDSMHGFQIKSDGYTKINPYSISFKAPEHRECVMEVKVMDHKQIIGQRELTYESECENLQCTNQLYLDLLQRMLPLLSADEDKMKSIDHHLAEAISVNNDNVPTKAFEQLFGAYEYSSNFESSEQELPTLLHLSARFGLLQFSKKLAELPSSFLSFGITNRDGKTPPELAAKHQHNELKEFLQAREIEETYNMYEIMQSYGYVNKTGLSTIGADGYTIATLPRRKASYDRPYPVQRITEDNQDFYLEMTGPISPSGQAEKVVLPGYMTMGVDGKYSDSAEPKAAEFVQEEYAEVTFPGENPPKAKPAGVYKRSMSTDPYDHNQEETKERRQQLRTSHSTDDFSIISSPSTNAKVPLASRSSNSLPGRGKVDMRLWEYQQQYRTGAMGSGVVEVKEDNDDSSSSGDYEKPDSVPQDIMTPISPRQQQVSPKDKAMNELKDIMFKVKEGSYTVHQASMLFDDWKKHYPDMNRPQQAREFKQMQQMQKLADVAPRIRDRDQPKPSTPTTPKQKGGLFAFTSRLLKNPSNAQEKKKSKENIQIKTQPGQTKKFTRTIPKEGTIPESQESHDRSGPSAPADQEMYIDVLDNRNSTTSVSSAGSSRDSRASTSSYTQDSGVDVNPRHGVQMRQRGHLATEERAIRISQQLRQPPPIPPRKAATPSTSDDTEEEEEEEIVVVKKEFRDLPPTPPASTIEPLGQPFMTGRPAHGSKPPVLPPRGGN